MLGRQRTGALICAGCGYLVAADEERCPHCGRWNPGLWGFAPVIRRLGSDFGFTTLVTAATAVLYAAMLLLSGSEVRMQGLAFLSPSLEVNYLFGAAGAVPVYGHGRWWTLLSAGWLHAGLLHIGFNLLWVRQLAPAVAELYGPGRTVILYTLSSVAGFFLSSTAGYLLPRVPLLGGAAFTLGASAAIFGLLGALTAYGSNGTLAGNYGRQAALILFLFGAIMPGVDNYAHAGGFIGGWAVAKWFNPARPERVDHLIGALACLVATAGAILVSILSLLVF